MRWFLKRVLIGWLALIAVCVAGVMIGKLDHAPDTLQALGFVVCDGEPCFQGIKPGMNWNEARKRLPETAVSGKHLVWPVKMMNIEVVIISPSRDGSSVQEISIIGSGSFFPITAGQIVAHYGSPCGVSMEGAAITLLYPTLTINVADSGLNRPNNFQLQVISPVSELDILIKISAHESCNSSTGMFSGVWHGFTSTNVYLKRYGAPSDFLKRP